MFTMRWNRRAEPIRSSPMREPVTNKDDPSDNDRYVDQLPRYPATDDAETLRVRECRHSQADSQGTVLRNILRTLRYRAYIARLHDGEFLVGETILNSTRRLIFYLSISIYYLDRNYSLEMLHVRRSRRKTSAYICLQSMCAISHCIQ